jgi:hypothetical protein
MRGLVVVGAAVAVLAMPAPSAIAVSPAQPINRVPPTISGSTQLGDTLTASPGEWSGDAPMKFSYGWFRSTDGDFLPIPGAHGPTYTITKDDATSSRGRKVLLTVEVTATNAVAYGFATPSSNVTVQARPVRPRNRILALVDARFVGGRASTIPQLLAHNGYRTSYWALQRGRIEVIWALEDPLDNPDVKRLATGHAVVRHRGTVPFKIRLTAWGRRQLRHAHHLTVNVSVHFKPRRPGGFGVSNSFEINRATPADDAKLIVPMIPGARARLPQPISFWASVASAISVPKGQPPSGNRRVIRPRAIMLFADGSWYVEKLRWHGWGTRVARATGISNASNGIPDQASGKRMKSHATVTLSNPGRFKGHEVYRCFDLHIPAHTASDMHLCLTRVNGYAYMGAVPPPIVDFFAGPPLQGIGCEMTMEQVLCASYAAALNQKVTLGPGGRVHACGKPVTGFDDPCGLGNFGDDTPTYKVGRKVTLGPFRCRVLESGVRCTVARTGKGFGGGPAGATRVG